MSEDCKGVTKGARTLVYWELIRSLNPTSAFVQALSEGDMSAASASICQHVLGLRYFQEARRVALYIHAPRVRRTREHVPMESQQGLTSLPPAAAPRSGHDGPSERLICRGQEGVRAQGR